MCIGAGLNFASYEALRGVITPPGKSSVARKLTCGALAGACLVHFHLPSIYPCHCYITNDEHHADHAPLPPSLH